MAKKKKSAAKKSAAKKSAAKGSAAKGSGKPKKTITHSTPSSGAGGGF